MDTSLSEEQTLQIEGLIAEISECREDERASKNQIIMIIAALATFLTAVVTVITYVLSLSDETYANLPFSQQTLQLIVTGLSTFVLCAAIPYIADLGLLSTVRHFYLIELEKRLKNLLNEKDFSRWETISTPLITFNYKHILPGYPSLYPMNMYITSASILILAIIYVLFIQLIIDEFNLFNILLTIIFWIIFFVALFTILVASQKSKEIYEMMKEFVEKTPEERKQSFIQKKNFSLYRYILYYQNNIFNNVSLL